MNRLEVFRFLKSFFSDLENVSGESQRPPDKKELKPFMELVLSLKRDLPFSIPLLRGLAVLTLGKDSGTTLLERRIERRYLRLCRVQEELGRLDFRKAAPGVSPEDYVFSRIDFSRYRKINEKDFEGFFLEGFSDFDGAFLKKNFGLHRKELQSLIEGSYKKAEGEYMIQKETPLILSVMRTLDTSLESPPLFTAEEIKAELKNLLGFMGGGGEGELLPGFEQLYSLLVSGLDNVLFTHVDGMTTKLFISPNGDLSATFRPGDKPWTQVLIPKF